MAGACLYSTGPAGRRYTCCASGAIEMTGIGVVQLVSEGACQSLIGHSVANTAGDPVTGAAWVSTSSGCCRCGSQGYCCQEGTVTGLTACCGSLGGEEQCMPYGACVAQLGNGSCTFSRCCCGPAENRQCRYVDGLTCNVPDDQTCGPGNTGTTFPGGTFFACPPCITSNPPPRYSCISDPCVATSGCCLCDRFCPLDATTCASKGGQPAASAAACKTANIKPKCIRAAWRLGIRPNAHYANMTRGVAPHRMSLFSKQTTKDLPSGECKTYYGWTQKHATRGMMHGAICNQFNQRCDNTRTVRKLKLVRHPSKGMMRFETKYRKPCPEVSDMGCGTMTSGCPGT